MSSTPNNLAPGERIETLPCGVRILWSAFFAEERTPEEIVHWMFTTDVERTRRSFARLRKLQNS